MSDKYILDGHTPVEEPDLIKWAKWFETADRIVVRNEIGDVIVSTVFLGLDHNFISGIPILFETMIFNGKHDQYQARYCTWDDAVAGHKKAVELVKGDE